MRWSYDPTLSFTTNKRSAIAAHEVDGPMVAVLLEGGGDEAVSHWLFPDGCSMGPSAGDLPADPYDPRACINPMEHRDKLRTRLENIRTYWQLRTAAAEREFTRAKEE